MKTICSIALTIGAGMMLMGATPLRAANIDKSIDTKIFHLLLDNRSLARGAETMTATIHDGNVTLVGDVVTPADKENLHNAIAGVPGVQHVNDKQLIPRSDSDLRYGSDVR